MSYLSTQTGFEKNLEKGGISYPLVPTSPYLELIDLDVRPEEEKFIIEAWKKGIDGFPLAARLMYKLYRERLVDYKTARTVARDVGPLLESIAFLKGIEHEDEILANPEILKEVIEAAEKLSKGIPVKIGNMFISTARDLRQVVPVSTVGYKPESPKSIEAAKKTYEAILKYLERHPELRELARKVGEGAEKGEGVRVVGPPRAVDVILSKLEVVREQGSWLGGVDLRLLGKLLQDVREGEAILWGAFGLLREWGRGNIEAFLEGFEGVKGVPERELSEHGLVGEVEKLRRGLANGELSVEDVSSALTALYTVYSMVGSRLSEFLSSVRERTASSVRPEDLEEQVIKPLRERLREVRVLVRGNVNI